MLSLLGPFFDCTIVFGVHLLKWGRVRTRPDSATPHQEATSSLATKMLFRNDVENLDVGLSRLGVVVEGV